MILRCIKIHITNSQHREFRETRKYIIYIFGFYHVDNKRRKMSVTIIMLSEDFSRRNYNNITMFPTTLIINNNTTIELIKKYFEIKHSVL